jgi:hypothetical protein
MNVQQILATASLISSLAPVFSQIVALIFATVRGIEQALPQSTGTQKFDAAMTQIEAVVGSISTEAKPLFTGLINGAVATLNAIGEFKSIKAGTAPTSPQPVSTT